MTTIKLGDLARQLGAKVVGDSNVLIHGVAGIREAGPGELTFLASERYEPHLQATGAAAVILAVPRAGLAINQVVHENPYLAYLKVLKIFQLETPRPEPGIDGSAIIGMDVELGKDVSVGPRVVIENGARIGDNTVLMANVYVGQSAVIGPSSMLFPNVVVRNECLIGRNVIIHPGAVIGADGFGYVREGSTHHKVPQVGNVVIEDDVEIGANTCIDRATTGTTLVGKGTKIDNLVQIGHNVRIGENVIIVAQVGVSGSTQVERGVLLAGQAGLIGHIRIGENAIVGAQAGVTKSVPAGAQVSGYPAQPHSTARRIHVLTMRLPQMIERLRILEEKLKAIEEERRESKIQTGG